MANKLLIVHGYSDGYMQKQNSFANLRDWLVQNRAYKRSDIYFVQYSSMDDQATFQDFADKLDEDYMKKIAPDRVDVLCHSTGALVTRAWLAMRRQRQREQGNPLDLPIHRLFMFAPANFGSDLARMGQSFVGRLRCTFFNKSAHRKEFMESGRNVLQGLEPASPYQWRLSMSDLHAETYFGPNDESKLTCFPFIFAAGEGYTGLQSKVVKARNKPGTDGTVRISGTSINAKKCTLMFAAGETKVRWSADPKHAAIPFAVFQGFNHGSIINTRATAFDRDIGPGPMLLKALNVDRMDQYRKVSESFHAVSEKNYQKAAGTSAGRYQQFFFKVRDDAGVQVDDFYIDFKVVSSNGRTHRRLNRLLDDQFETRVSAHSQDRSMRVMLLELESLKSLFQEVTAANARIILSIEAKRPYHEVHYEDATFTIFDSKSRKGNDPLFLYPNTTTMVEVILNRRPSDKILKMVRL